MDVYVQTLSIIFLGLLKLKSDVYPCSIHITRPTDTLIAPCWRLHAAGSNMSVQQGRRL